MRNTKLLMRAIDDKDVYMVSVPDIRFIATWEQGTKRKIMQLSDVRKGGRHITCFTIPLDKDSIEGMRCENTRCSLYPKNGQDEVLCSSF